MELEQLLEQTAKAIERAISLPDFRPTKVSMWLKFVRLGSENGTPIEQTTGHVQKLIFVAASFPELVRQVAENLILAVYGAEVPVVREMPNLIVRLFDQKAWVQVPGAPPIDQADQIFLKATVYRYEPDLWAQLFGRSKGE